MGIAELGAVLRETRVRRGMSQQALADQAGALTQLRGPDRARRVHPHCRHPEPSRRRPRHHRGRAARRGDPRPGDPGDTVPVPLVADRIAAGPPLFLADHVEALRAAAALAPAQPRRRSPSRRCWCGSGRTRTRWPTRSRRAPRSCSTARRVREIVPQGIYAVREDAAGETGCTIKRLVLDAASRVLILLSDNPAHLPRAIRLQGRARRSGGRRRSAASCGGLRPAPFESKS